MNQLIDSHCHLQFNGYNENREEVIKRCLQKGMLLNIVGTQSETSKKAVGLAETQENFYATIGLHPTHITSVELDEEESHFKTREEKFDKKYYRELAKTEKVVAIGECGIDLFHIPKNLDINEVITRQKQEFIKQIELAQELDLALVVHVRNSNDENLPDAYDIAYEILRERCHPELDSGPFNNKDSDFHQNDKLRGVIHCYGGNAKQAQKFVDLGFYIGITGIATFPARKTNPKPTEELLQTIRETPIDKLLIETDAPYLAPQKYRGKQNEPWMVEEVAEKIAEIKGVEKKEVIEITYQNCKKLFKI